MSRNILWLVFVALLLPTAALARKKSPILRPASKPPVYKKYKNKKQKHAKFGARPKT